MRLETAGVDHRNHDKQPPIMAAIPLSSYNNAGKRGRLRHPEQRIREARPVAMAIAIQKMSGI